MIGSAQCQISIQNVFFNGLQLASSVLPLAIAPMVLYYNVNLKDDALSYILFFFFREHWIPRNTATCAFEVAMRS